MEYTEAQKEKALHMFFDDGLSESEVRALLGYPSRASMSRWVCGDSRYLTAHLPEKSLPSHVKYTYRVRKKAVELALEGKLSRREIAAKLGICSGPMVTKWLTVYRKKGMRALMTRDERRKAAQAAAAKETGGDVEKLRAENEQLKLEKAILEETVKILKKDRCVGANGLTNKDKTVITDALSPQFGLGKILVALSLARSSYYYHRAGMRLPEKYAELRIAIREEFAALNRANGYRYVQQNLRRRTEPIVVSEKVTRRIMAEENLFVVYDKKARRKYSSYKGEISEAPDNLVNRDFHADAPNILWLSDITEFKLPDDPRKIYLSPILDCFDGYLPSWSIGLSPSADLANSSLLKACTALLDGEHPTCHTDRGCHYRWPGWIAICEANGIVRSMSKKGCSPDNSACEGLFGRLKNEFFYDRNWHGVSAEEFIEQLNGYLEYYNESRMKASLNWLSPTEYRRKLGYAA